MLMDGQSYLDQISQNTKPATPTSKFNLSGILSSTIFKIIAGAVLFVILAIIFGSILSNANNKGKLFAEQLSVRLANLTETTSNCNEYLKNSDLRSFNAQFSTVLTDTNSKLSTFLAEKLEFNPQKPPENIAKQETDFINELNSELENARLNGLLDRTYVNKIQTQISLILSLEESIRERAKDLALAEILNSSASNLENLLNKLQTFDISS